MSEVLAEGLNMGKFECIRTGVFMCLFKLFEHL